MFCLHRTPRVELGRETTPAKAGHRLSKFMHDEDNKHGLRVTNARGEKWIAWGDGMLLNEEGEDTYSMAVQAVQASVHQVYEAFQHPDRLPNSSLVTDYVPVVDAAAENNYPMFQVSDGKLLRRANLNDLGDPKTTSNWAGVTTVAELWSSYKPKNSVIDKSDDK